MREPSRRPPTNLKSSPLPHSQVSAGRPIPVLPQHTFPGNVILSSRATSGLSPPVLPDAELEKLSLGHLSAAARSMFAALEAVGGPPAPPLRSRGEDSDSDTMSGAIADCAPLYEHKTWKVVTFPALR